MPTKAKIISVLNFKGGVGKTSISVNLAGCLADQYRKEVLLIDLDVQSSCGQWLMGAQQWQNWSSHAKKTSYQIFRDIINSGMVWSVEQSCFQFEDCPRLWLSPATYDMLEFDNQLRNALSRPNTPKGFQFLQKRLSDASYRFKYIILDCPPAVNLISENALFFSDYVIIPTVPDFLSVAGLKRLIAHIEKLGNDYLTYKNPPARIMAILFCKFKTNDIIHREKVDEVTNYISEKGASNFICDNIILQKIRERVHVYRSQEQKLPVTIAFPESQAAADIVGLSDKITKGF